MKKRNLFKGLEIGEINGRFGFEGVASATDENAIYSSTEASINASLIFPRFLIPLKERTFYKYGQYNPRTKISSGYTYSDRPEYQRGITNVSGTYTWDINHKKQFSLTAVNLNIIDSDLSPKFDQQLKDLQQQGNNLINAFKRSFVSSMIFSFTWNPTNYGNQESNSHIIRTTLESGGTFLNIGIPKILLERNLELYQYLRLSFDFRKNIILDKSRSLAYRINSGIGLPYGSSNDVLPYEKNFFAGGSNSIRAWRPRRLGIGSQPPPLSLDTARNGVFDYKYEKPGEILIEGSIELRQKLFGFVSSAIFLDVGNVWLFRELTPPPAALTTPKWSGNTKFNLSSFLSEFGVGTGFGLRFDFNFLLLRLDVGIKAWDPARQAGDRFVLDNLRFYKPYSKDREPVIYNIGIGYPF
ncbi:MAG: BamA/TamA family outer membrane protein [Bacteroidia bacterium]|nr:BamA/TamA family outer membrane protein [Bacteroidia bacterium]